MLFAGRRTHNNIEVFYGFEGGLMGSIMGSQNIMGSDFGSNISVTDASLLQLVPLKIPSSLIINILNGWIRSHSYVISYDSPSNIAVIFDIRSK
jgi:hypothetical protein